MTALSKPTSSPIQCEAVLVRNEKIAKDTFRLRVRAPQIANRILPGQFVMLRTLGRTDPLLARAYALYETVDGPDNRPESIDIVYVVLGNGTRTLSSLSAPATVELWGPLGNTFPIEFPAKLSEHLLIVAGGIGQTPFPAVIGELLGLRSYGGGRAVQPPKRISVAYGVRSAEYLAGVEDFRRTGSDLQLATDDGSAGHHGFVTELAEQLLDSSEPPTAIFGCGPEPMLERLSKIAQTHEVPCWVSLESKMACGYGVCFSCVCRVRQEGGWDYRRVCLEGSIFPAESLEWE